MISGKENGQSLSCLFYHMFLIGRHSKGEDTFRALSRVLGLWPNGGIEINTHNPHLVIYDAS